MPTFSEKRRVIARVTQPTKPLQPGFTLTELLVSLLLGVLVLIAAASLFSSGSRTHRTTDAISRIQEQQRLAFELMARDIRNAGSFPCKGMNDLVWLPSYVNNSDYPELRYYLASGLFGNYSEVQGVINHPDGTQTPIRDRVSKSQDGFDSLVIVTDPRSKGLQHPVIEHRRPNGPIKALNLDKRDWWNHDMIICNADVAIYFGTDEISGDTISIKSTRALYEALRYIPDGRGICGGGFTRNPDVEAGSTDCLHDIPLGPSYCFWGDMSIQPTTEDKQACDEIGQSQAYIYSAADFMEADYSIWYVDNIDDQGRGDLFYAQVKVAEGITGLQLRYRLKGTKNYIDAQTLIDTTEPFDFLPRKGGMGQDIHRMIVPSSGWSQVDSVHLKMTFQSKDNVGTEGKPLERTMETYIAIRSRMPEIQQ